MLKKANKDGMAAQHYNSCPFMAMKSTKLKHFNLDDKKKRGEYLSRPVHFFTIKKKCTPSLLLVLFIPKKKGGERSIAG